MDLVDRFTPDGYTQLMLALFENDRQKAFMLLVQGANPSLFARNSSKVTALHLLAGLGDLVLVEAALALTSETNLQRSDGRTPLHEAVVNGHEEAILALIRAGADPWFADHEGVTPFSLAQQQNNEQVIALLTTNS